MSNRNFDIKTTDTRPAISAELSADALDEIVGVEFSMVDATGNKVIDGAAGVIIQQPTETEGGIVSYQWQPQDTANAGTYRAEFTAVFDDGRQETYPNTGYLTVNISDRL